ncbi:hypothetical protein [Planobispora longispora]|uniref:Transposase n=1 Tax=Planobispora longispora TaxID=28887 RepID=A0A8J3W922_9ACTN|nr:hypothetical protein [Planobispora longispora]GIH79426.1 hypothetical protein Plo01_58550 [Planobispora longispora]
MLRRLVIELLGNEWSPEQIVGHLRLMHAGNPLMRISHESIYRVIYTTRWKLIPRELRTKLRTGRPIGKSKKNTVKGQWRSQITGARPIEEHAPSTHHDVFGDHDAARLELLTRFRASRG